MANTVPLAEYLFTRLRQLGVQSIHGVPGDYNLTLLDYVKGPDLHWVGNCNELNAGYAADGYARIKGLSALITTFGVGELSAANAIAGAYAELAPVVHIVGTPARQLQDSRARVHHTFNDGEYRRFALMHEHITVAQASLWDPRTCPLLIDTTIQQCLVHSRPVYIQLPADMVSIPVAAERLQSKIELPNPVQSIDEEAALTLILNRMYTSQKPAILIDGESKAYGILDELEELIKATQWPTWTSSWGKSLISETLPNFRGIWKGDKADTPNEDRVNSSDLILCFGPHFTNTNTSIGLAIPETEKTIFFSSSTVSAGNKIFRDLPAKGFLSTLLKKLDISKLKRLSVRPTVNGETPKTASQPAEGLVTQDKFYRKLSSFLRSGDIVLAETGTAGYGCHDLDLPPNTHLFKPVTWLSIGYMLPATQGAALAQRELHASGKWAQARTQHDPRTILLIGDGSFQMTVQELSTIIREKLNVTIFLINNNGYTIERCLHGWDQAYNDIATWRYLQAPSFFGASENKEADYPAHTFTVKTWGDLQSVLDDKRMNEGPGLRMVEVFMGQEDAPALLLAKLEETKAVAQKAKEKR